MIRRFCAEIWRLLHSVVFWKAFLDGLLRLCSFANRDGLSNASA